ncbi:MAG: DNA-binding protein [Desulfobulbaceae bacterium]|nr:MAG: DNA-binding protein [Desulfobulbaceae bacterium]
MFKKMIFALCVLLFTAGTALAALNINTATKEELQGLSGIGPAKAAAIIEHRERVGKFMSVDDLVNVEGIGAKTVDALRESITVK